MEGIVIWQTLIQWLTGRASYVEERRKELARRRQAAYYRRKKAKG